MKRICNPYSVHKPSLLQKMVKQPKTLAAIAISLICVISIFASTSTSFKVSRITELYYQPVDSIALYNDSIDNVKSLLTDEIHAYMTSVYPMTKMSAQNITDICLEKNFDIPLLLSQAHLESHFGKRTGGSNSCFGVLSRKYKHVDESVHDYVRIMQKNYVRTRSAEACIASGFRVEGSKHLKYAEDPSYSQTIRSIRSTIIKKTKIPTLVEKINHLDSLRNNLIMLNNGSPEERDTNQDTTVIS